MGPRKDTQRALLSITLCFISEGEEEGGGDGRGGERRMNRKRRKSGSRRETPPGARGGMNWNETN